MKIHSFPFVAILSIYLASMNVATGAGIFDDLKESIRKAGEGFKSDAKALRKQQIDQEVDTIRDDLQPDASTSDAANGQRAKTQEAATDIDSGAGKTALLGRQDIEKLQQCLNVVGESLKFNAGTPDGVPGAKTHEGIKIFIDAYVLPLDGQLNEALLESACVAANEVSNKGRIDVAESIDVDAANSEKKTDRTTEAPMTSTANAQSSVEEFGSLQITSSSKPLPASNSTATPTSATSTPMTPEATASTKAMPSEDTESEVQDSSSSTLPLVSDHSNSASPAVPFRSPYNLSSVNNENLSTTNPGPESILSYVGPYGEQRIDKCIANALVQSEPLELPYAIGQTHRPFVDRDVIGEYIKGEFKSASMLVPPPAARAPILYTHGVNEFAFLMPPGESIHAMADGTVTAITPSRENFPSWIHVTHDDDSKLSYGAVAFDALSVKIGDRVFKGTKFAQLPVGSNQGLNQLRVGTSEPIPCLLFRTAAGLAEPLREGVEYSRLPVDSPEYNLAHYSRLCELHAESQTDPDRLGDGVPLANIDVGIAYPACRDGLDLAPKNTTLMKHIGRVFLASGDVQTATLWLEKAVQEGSSDAAFRLGDVMASKNITRSVGLYRIAAESCHAGAMRKLHNAYRMAQGVPPHPQNEKIARQWINQADLIELGASGQSEQPTFTAYLPLEIFEFRTMSTPRFDGNVEASVHTRHGCALDFRSPAGIRTVRTAER